ncbi:MAG: diadenylate cyclase CdaA [Bacillota bacterium]
MSLLPQLKALTPLDLVTSIIDIALVAYVLYRLFMIIRGTRAVQLIKGVVALVIATTVSGWLHLYTVNWLMRQAQVALLVALPVVFQPELRRALEHIGRGRIFARSFMLLGEDELKKVIEQVTRAAELLAKSKTGALIVIEREVGLKDIAETGTTIDGVISAEFLVNIFVPKTPLHDGAVILRGDRIVAAGCFLPMTDRQDLERELGARHRSALGITEHSDALAVVVSEETGSISLASGGKLIRHLDLKTLAELLQANLIPRPMAGGTAAGGAANG